MLNKIATNQFGGILLEMLATERVRTKYIWNHCVQVDTQCRKHEYRQRQRTIVKDVLGR